MQKLDPVETQALLNGMDDEYKTRLTWEQVIRDFGAPPFINIVKTEQRHIESLLGLCAKYGVPPPNRWPGGAPRYASMNMNVAC